MSMTNLPIPSSNRQRRVEHELKNYRDGLYKLAEFQRMLGCTMDIDFTMSPDYRSIGSNGLFDEYDIPVESKHVRNMLQKYIDNDISEKDLSDWATIIFSNAAYVPTGSTEEEQETAGDGPTWDILQRLISPHIFDKLNESVVKMYLEMLNG